MEKLGVQIGLESSRLSYSLCPVRSTVYFDGRYNVNNVYEEIYAVRTFRHKNHNIKKVYNKEVAHYTFLSAKNVGKDEEKDDAQNQPTNDVHFVPIARLLARYGDGFTVTFGKMSVL